MKAIIVNVDGLTIKDKKLINEALSKIKNVNKCNPTRWDKVVVMYGPPSDCDSVVFRLDRVDPNPTHTPMQVLAMAGMLMHDDKREIKYYNNDVAQQSVIVGKGGITKIEVYNEPYVDGIIPYLAVWKGDVLYMRTPALGKEIVYA